MQFISIAVTLLILPGVVSIPARASDRQVPDVAFATQLGSGIYKVDESTIQVYRFAPSFNLRSVENRKWGMRLQFPLTFGFYDFTITDVIIEGLPRHLTTIALVPSLEIPIVVTETWFLTPFAAIGVGKDLSVGSTSFIYATGLSSLALFSFDREDIRLGNRFVYTGYTNKHLTFQDDFSFLESGLDIRRSLGIRMWRHDLAGSLFGVNYLKVASPQVVRQIEKSVDLRANWELGFTLGTVEPWKLMGLRLPRLGLGFRFGDDGKALRFVIGNPFPLDAPRTMAGLIQQP